MTMTLSNTDNIPAETKVWSDNQPTETTSKTDVVMFLGLHGWLLYVVIGVGTFILVLLVTAVTLIMRRCCCKSRNAVNKKHDFSVVQELNPNSTMNETGIISNSAEGNRTLINTFSVFNP